MKKYIYTAVNPCHTIITINGTETRISLCKDEVYNLPQNDTEVKKLLEAGLLQIFKPQNKYNNVH